MNSGKQRGRARGVGVESRSIARSRRARLDPRQGPGDSPAFFPARQAFVVADAPCARRFPRAMRMVLLEPTRRRQRSRAHNASYAVRPAAARCGNSAITSSVRRRLGGRVGEAVDRPAARPPALGQQCLHRREIRPGRAAGAAPGCPWSRRAGRCDRTSAHHVDASGCASTLRAVVGEGAGTGKLFRQPSRGQRRRRVRSRSTAPGWSSNCRRRSSSSPG